MHHAQRHGFVTLLINRQFKAVGDHSQVGIEDGRQTDTIISIAHRPAIVVMQMIGIPQNHFGLPLKTFKRFKNCGTGADMIG